MGYPLGMPALPKMTRTRRFAQHRAAHPLSHPIPDPMELDEHVEDQPYADDVSSTAESPGYIGSHDLYADDSPKRTGHLEIFILYCSPTLGVMFDFRDLAQMARTIARLLTEHGSIQAMIDRAIQRNSTHTQDDASHNSGEGLRRPVQPARFVSTNRIHEPPFELQGTDFVGLSNDSKR
ncbi:hypothetical protein Tco_1516003 [Tanacetum coccineum]